MHIHFNHLFIACRLAAVATFCPTSVDNGHVTAVLAAVWPRFHTKKLHKVL
jgi:hypothetical protein